MMNEQQNMNKQPGIVVKSSKQPNVQQKKQDDLEIIKNQLKEMTDNYISFIRRVRILEEKFNNLQKKISLMDKVSLDNHKENKNTITNINSEIYSIQRGIGKIKDNIHIIVSDLKETAKLNDVEELEKYVDMWQPCNFVTSNDVNAIVKRIVEKSLEDVHLKLQEEKNLKKIAENIFSSKSNYFNEIIEEMLLKNGVLKKTPKSSKKTKNSLKETKSLKKEEKDSYEQKNKSRESEVRKKRQDIWGN